MNPIERELRPTGTLALTLIRKPRTSVPDHPLSLMEIILHGLPRWGLSHEINLWRLRNMPNLLRGFWRVAIAQLFKISHFYGQLSLVVIRKDGAWVDYGLASLRVVTNNGVGYIVDAFENLVEPENMKYHGLGTGTNAEAAGDSALQTELTTQYNPDSTRATGTTTETSANIYRTVGTNTVDAAAAVTEHGILSQAATGGGVLFDRSVFSVVNLANGDSLQTTYDLTLTAGG